LFGLVVVKYHVPYWVGLPLALVAGGMVGMGAEAGVVRRLRAAPRVVSVVATLGVGQFLATFGTAINSTASSSAFFPQPPGMPQFNIGALRVTPSYSGMLILSPVLVIAVMAFFRFSRLGLAMRAAASNPEAARMSGIYSARMSSLAWAIAGGLSAFAAILTQPTLGFTTADNFGPSLLLRALTAAVVARMRSVSIALCAGIGLGVLEQLLLWNYPRSGLVEVMLFVVILVALLMQPRETGRDKDNAGWGALDALPPLPEVLRRIWLVRNLGLIVGMFALAGAACLPLLADNSLSTQFTGIIAFSIVGLSVGILTGLAGQLTLGQFMVAAVGAMASYFVTRTSGDFALGLLYAGLAAGAVSVLVGLPALRLRGLMLTVTSLSFALAGPAWLLTRSWTFGSGVSPRAPTIDGYRLDTGHRYYYFALAVLAVCLLIARNVRRSGFGRLLVAIRDNEDNARAFGVPAAAIKLQGYLLAGFIAGIGGAVYAHSLSSIDSTTFPVDASISVVVMTIVGGVSVMAGPIIGALYVLAVPLLPLDSASLAATELGTLLVVLFVPRGLASLLRWPRDWLAWRIARRYGVDAGVSLQTPAQGVNLGALDAIRERARADGIDGVTARRPDRLLLEATGLRKSFGGVHAVRGVSLEVHSGETVGLIGPNGAGKTTTFELISGFTRPDAGRVRFDSRDVTFVGPEARSRIGLVRSFQDSALFPTMTVTDAVQIGLERVEPTHFLGAVLGSRRAERQRLEWTRDVIAAMGLEAYRDTQIRQLSTGTRRIAELSCLVATRPTLLLLDEPSSGVAQRETEALGGLLSDLKSQFHLTMLIIEHDIPLITSISDRIIAMASGEVLTVGTPAEVRVHPGVVEAYLGGDRTAIERTGRGDEASTRKRRGTVGARR
jgi:ABC-type branched-subunit amino acid transport system ATPase component/ABC-type branched-subunit amino acid transport system permease subunit